MGSGVLPESRGSYFSGMQKRDDAKFNDEPVISTNPVDIAIQKFDNHPSANLIRDKITLSDMFQFESFSS